MKFCIVPSRALAGAKLVPRWGKMLQGQGGPQEWGQEGPRDPKSALGRARKGQETPRWAKVLQEGARVAHKSGPRRGQEAPRVP